MIQIVIAYNQHGWYKKLIIEIIIKITITIIMIIIMLTTIMAIKYIIKMMYNFILEKCNTIQHVSIKSKKT